MPKPKQYTFPTVAGIGELKKDYNVFLQYGEEHKRLISFTMRPDGSLIVFNQAPHDGEHYSARRIPARKGMQTLKLKDMEQIEYTPSAVPGKLTFHATGIVNFDNMRRGVRTSLKTMDITQPLVTFIHPQISELTTLSRKIRIRDIVFRYDDWPANIHPMIKVYISPPGEGNIILKYMEDGTILGALEVVYLGDEIRHSSKELHVQVTLELGPESNVPRHANQFVILDNDQLIPSTLKPKYGKV